MKKDDRWGGDAQSTCLEITFVLYYVPSGPFYFFLVTFFFLDVPVFQVGPRNGTGWKSWGDRVSLFLWSKESKECNSQLLFWAVQIFCFFCVIEKYSPCFFHFMQLILQHGGSLKLSNRVSQFQISASAWQIVGTFNRETNEMDLTDPKLLQEVRKVHGRSNKLEMIGPYLIRGYPWTMLRMDENIYENGSMAWKGNALW